MRLEDCKDDIVRVVVTEEQIKERLAEMGAQISEDYAGEPLVVVGVLRGAVMVVADLVREISIPLHMDWMAVSSYGDSTKSSGVVRILKDLNSDIADVNVLIVEDIIDTGLTLDYLKQYLEARGPKSVRIATFLRKPDAAQVDVPVDYVGFDIPNEFVVGYGLDYAEDYRHLNFVGTLAPHVYGG
ncbi:hypoxanthine phosphoribosyltransferase [Trueperella bonasi]|uniref:Hypoxanthine phosphoribosyltransferase n=1 Tax=Trueperella bonasi TaxID=312286 RepID=A0ABT9NHH1_9ACTO|nr:hypoxanthine phosphoribosyltransferase [Trueperella bonasi]MDP9806637.1 hypoxanthine phosphoribosyltransferase [Trueperella bonasi]